MSDKQSVSGRPPAADVLGDRSYAAVVPEYQTKSDVAYLRLRQLVLSADLRPGEVIDQDRLTRSLGISRMPLRQALTRLASEGLVSLSPHRSAMVAPLLPSDIDEIYATREVLESLLIQAATPKLTPSDYEQLAELCLRTQQYASTGTPREFAAVDRQFHTRLYAVAEYARALAFFENLRDQSDRYVAFYYSQQADYYTRDAKISADHHDEILAACQRQDAKAAIEAMLTDSRQTAQHLKRIASGSLPV